METHKKNNIDANEAFLEYEEMIVSNPEYEGMPDARRSDGSIQWEAPSNRSAGEYQFTHDKRYEWWKKKAAEKGISTEEDKWISKVAKLIHPTKQHPCKVCGRVMDIRYCYLSSRFIKRIKALPFVDSRIYIDELTHILDFIPNFIDTYGSIAYQALPSLLRCKQFESIPALPDNLDLWTKWIEEEYIPREPSLLSPGVMSNAPDRLDGFHTFNRCCRSTADKGRTKENLASYSTDRRAFEFWSDGNWITANKLMGYINSNPAMKNEHCANEADGGHHPRPCSADHIGPISLGFCHRPEFQLLCSPCNSAKNNRMYYSDVRHLIDAESHGETVTSWYATPIWNKCKNRVKDAESALKLSRIMRDNRNIALSLLADFMHRHEYLFLLTLLNLDYADYEYEVIPGTTRVIDHIVTVEFSKKPSGLRYVTIQKTRKIRVAFSSLDEYASKGNRNGFMYTDSIIESLKHDSFSILSKKSSKLKEQNNDLVHILNDNTSDVESGLLRFLNNLDYPALQAHLEFHNAYKNLQKIMSLVAEELASKWNDSRYSREF